MSDSPDLPVAAKFGDGGEFVKKSDAEEAIKEARQQERQEILDKMKNRRKKLENRVKGYFADEYDLGLLEELKNWEENLRDDLEESEEGGSE